MLLRYQDHSLKHRGLLAAEQQRERAHSLARKLGVNKEFVELLLKSPLLSVRVRNLGC